MVEVVETIQKLHTWDHSWAFFSVLFYKSIITITFVTGQRGDSCSSSSTIRRSTLVLRETEEALRTVC